MLKSSKVAVITGITGGIGKAIALTFAREGMNLVGISRSREEVIKVLEKIRQNYQIDYLALTIDVSRNEEVDNILPKTIEKFNRVDILVNNAAIGKFDYIIDSNLDDWQKIIDTNLKGVYLCSKVVLPQMIKQKSGKIVNISSICGLRGSSKWGIYCASKFGVLGLTEVLAKEVKPHNIVVSAVCPGIVDTGFANNINYTLTDKTNMLKPEAIAELVLKLIKPGSGSQVCEIILKPRDIIQRLLKIKKRKAVIKRIKYL